ncbi:MAG: hypothetical protein HRU04_18510 [Oceanospirillaceae bacterium]|nr:hypothetical protein [Oceanospirillaceae bacterium]
MPFKRPERLENSVKVTGYNRPIKIAFITSNEENNENHAVLDAIFKYSYTCWGGAKFLVIPTSDGDIIDQKFLDWLDFYDADIVYSFIPLKETLVKNIEKSNSPAHLIEHDFGREGKYLAVKIEHYCNPVSSISTIHSPLVFTHRRPVHLVEKVNIISQNSPAVGDRFITDNFGNQYSMGTVLHEVRDLFGTICLTAQNTLEYNCVGTYTVNSTIEIIGKLARREAISISRLASIHTESIGSTRADGISDSFAIFVGSSVEDRICFWNSRKFYSDRHDSACSLILSAEQLSDNNFLKALGEYLNKLNFTGSNHNKAVLRSKSVTNNKLIEISEGLRLYTHNIISVAHEHDKIVAPTKQQLEDMYRFITDKVSFTVTEDISDTVTNGPEHLKYIPAIYKSHAAGEFFVECSIDRHNNLSAYNNVVDSWLLPRRAYVSGIFGPRCLRVSKNKLPTFLVGKSNASFGRIDDNSALSIKLTLPGDIDIINFLIIGKKNYPKNDMRCGVFKTNIEYITHSDKGKNFIGVVSVFGSLGEAAKILTNKLWRDVYDHIIKQDGSYDYIFKYDKIKNFSLGNEITKAHIMKELRLSSINDAKKFIAASFKDSFELLIRKEVISPVYIWACDKCGHKNLKSVDTLQAKNWCDICSYKHDMLIGTEFSWMYLLNKFIHKTVYVNHALPVIWGLNEIQKSSRNDSFFYAPEVLLKYDYRDKNKNEIDLIGVYDGKFFVGEAKRSADYFCDKEGAIETFLNIIEETYPDEAYLIFEKISDDDSKLEETRHKIAEIEVRFRLLFKQNISLKVLVSSENEDYISPFDGLDFSGKNTSKLYDDWEKSESIIT